MHEYDVTLKLLLQRLTAMAARELTGVAIARWHNVELPEVRQTRIDLLGETAAGTLIHIELQSGNDSAMAVRMLEYGIGVYRRFGKFPAQIVLYTGEETLRMRATLIAGSLNYRYRLVNARDLDGEPLLASPHVSDNILAILTRLKDGRSAVRRILAKIAEQVPGEREIAFKQFLILAGLRKLEQYIEGEAKKMPILNDIMDHKVIGRAIRQGLEQGREEGREEGSRNEVLALLRRMAEKRFGALPDWAEAALANRSRTELEDLFFRLGDVETLEILLQ